VTVSGANIQPETRQHGVKCRFSGVGTGTVHQVRGSVTAGGTQVLCPTPLVTMTTSTLPFLLSLSFNVEGNAAPQWSSGFAVSVYRSPIIESSIPKLISAEGETEVVLLGQNFLDTSSAACKFGTGFSVKIKYKSDTSVTCVMPSTLKKSAQVSVCVTLNGVDCSDTFNLLVYGILQLYPPAMAQTGGTMNATLNAIHQPQESGCADKSCIRVKFIATVNLLPTISGVKEFNATTLGTVMVVDMPVGLNPGKQELKISLNMGIDWAGGVFVHVYSLPEVTSTLPCAGPVSGATRVTMRTSGKPFFQLQSLAPRCSFGGIHSQATLATLSDCTPGSDAGTATCTTASCESPSVASAEAQAKIESFNVSTASAGQGVYDVAIGLLLNTVHLSPASRFIYYPVPQMLSLAPSACPHTGTARVTITGRDLTGGYNGSRLCRFMPAAPTQHELLFLDPQSSATADAPPQPMVTAAEYIVHGGTHLVCPCPHNVRVQQQAVRLVLSLNAQQYEGAGMAAALHAPIKLYFTTPLSGDVQGSDVVYATGANFFQGPGLQMIFGTERVPATVIRDGVIKALSPRSINYELAKVPIRVTNNAGADVSPTSTVFEYYSAGTGCPLEKETQRTCFWGGFDKGLYNGECYQNKCRCRRGYWGAACSMVPVTGALFPLSGVPSGGTTVSVRGLFLGGECCSLQDKHNAVPYPLAPQNASLLRVKITNSNFELRATYETFNDALLFVAQAYPSGSQISMQVNPEALGPISPKPQALNPED
jgi:hypothetical protein